MDSKQNSPPEENKDQATPNLQQNRKLNVKTLSNNVFQLNIAPNIPIKELKQIIESVSKVPIDRQRLIYMGKVIKDEDLLTNYINEDGQTIHLMAKVSLENNAPQPNTQQPMPGYNNQSNLPGAPNIFSLGFSIPQSQNLPNQRINQQGNSVFIRAVSTNNNNPNELQNISQTFNSLLGNLMGGNALNPNQMNQNPSNLNNLNAPNNSTQTSSTNVINNSQNQQPNQNLTNNIFQSLQRNHGVPSPENQATHNTPNVHNSQNIRPPVQNIPPFIHFQPINIATSQNNTNNLPQNAGITVSPQGINLPSPPRTIFNQTTQGTPLIANPQPITSAMSVSPNQNILNMSTLLNRLMGEQAHFPGPVLPRPNVALNTVSNLGNYLYNYQFQVMRATPYLSRLSDLLIRESLINNPQDRVQLEHLSHEIGTFFEEMILATRPLVNLLKNLHLGDYVGNYRLVDYDMVGERMFDQNAQRSASNGYIANNLINRPMNSPNQLPQTANFQAVPLGQNNNNPRENRGEIQISISGIEIEDNNANNQRDINRSNNNNNINQSQTQNNNGNPDLLNMLGVNNINLGGLLNGLLGNIGNNPNNNLSHNNPNINSNENQNPQNTNAVNNTLNRPPTTTPMTNFNLNPDLSTDIHNRPIPRNLHSISNQQTMPQNTSQNLVNNQPSQNQVPQMDFNIQNMMGGNMLQGVMDYTLRDLMMENYANQLEGMDEEFIKIFGHLKIGEIVTGFVGRNLNFLSRHQSEIRVGLLEVLSSHNNDQKGLIEKISNEMKDFFIPGPNFQSLIFEGFNPSELTSEILNRNLEILFAIMLKEYDQNSLADFERDFSNILKKTFGEVFYEISEGLTNGYSDFELIFKDNIKNMITRIAGPQMAMMIEMMAMPNLIPHVRNCYDEYKSFLEEKNKTNIEIEESKENENLEAKLLEKIEKFLEEDKEDLEKLQKIEFSEEYIKGDINYKG